jgi:transposase
MAFFLYHYQRPARKHYGWWHNWAVCSRLKPMIEKARMIQRRFDNIVIYLRLRITHTASESINSKIQWVKYIARGFRSKRNFVTAIYFHCGGLDLLPSTKFPECPWNSKIT